MTETIYAPATLIGRAGVSVIRISGPDCVDIVEALTGKDCPKPRLASLAKLYHPHSKEHLDTSLLIYFKAPYSFTGEDVVELHLHGGRAVMQAVTEALTDLKLLRPAENGEFSRRGFENGKMDLTEAEAIADLVDAETAAQRQQALRQMDGELGALYNGWADRLARTLAHIEADLEFPDEDLPDELAAKNYPVLTEIMQQVQAHLEDGRKGERVREGLFLTILGQPNAGKSSLLNALARRDVAIVSDIAGTTRDVVEVQLDIGGYPVSMADTAGLREKAADAVEDEGIRRALARAEDADLKIVVLAADDLEASITATKGLMDKDALVLINKIDQVESYPTEVEGHPVMAISAKSGDGLSELLKALEDQIQDRFAAGSTMSLTRARHRHALEEAMEHMQRSFQAPLPELIAEDVRMAVRAIGKITGKIDVEDLLDMIFKDFCIGK